MATSKFYQDSMGKMVLPHKDHLTSFQDCIDNFYVEDDDVFSRMFSHSLEGEAKKWFKNLPNGSLRH
jgi:hypothetical protein